MLPIGERPIVWHIMKGFAAHGLNEFVLCLGYKGEYIKRYFTEALAGSRDITVDFVTGTVHEHKSSAEPWRITMVDTGHFTETAGRLLKMRDYLDDEPFMLTYGDGVADVDLRQLLEFHREHGRLATVTAVHPTAHFGQLALDGPAVSRFDEKPQMTTGWINGGYFVLDPGIFDYIPGDVDWAKEPLERLATAGQLCAFRHEGFWQCMDALRDKIYLNTLWEHGDARWKVWP
jgi:glucose-1-phosphate cytidylyltransferase